MRTLTHRVLLFSSLGVALFATADARAQITGTVNKPLPNVLLIVDNSGSMERMPNNTLPSDNLGAPAGTTNVCTPGSPSNPNRWGMLVQALTGNLQPYYSCEAMDRSSNPATNFTKIYQINGKNPYDADYDLPFHRMISGKTGSPDTACTLVPFRLPGGTASNGVGYWKGGYGASGLGSDAKDFPSDAVVSYGWTSLNTKVGSSATFTSADPDYNCLFDQANDGQLDAIQDYVRLGLMTFDNDPSYGIGVNTPTGTPPPPAGATGCGGSIITAATNDPFLGMWSYIPVRAGTQTTLAPNKAVDGNPVSCTTPSVFELGARHNAAPPWEGRMVMFPDPYADLLAVETTNKQIQGTLMASRPYGATPLDAVMDDARDYFYEAAFGPKNDDYVNGGCRDQYIILMTDGAPNQNMRKNCEGTVPGPAGHCPYGAQAYQTADALYNHINRLTDYSKTGPNEYTDTTLSANLKVQTFVIGFSVNGDGTTFANDGFPASLAKKTCKDWYADASVGGNNDPKTMDTACTSTNPPGGSTADACCQLNKIALYGSGGPLATNRIGPFFAESQADLVLAFSRILALVTKTASSRTVPAVAPATTVSGGTEVSGQFVSSFVPNAFQPWSGEIDRTRTKCVNELPTPISEDAAKGDSYAADLAAQSVSKKRFFITEIGAGAGTRPAAPKSNGATAVDSYRTMRPWLSGVPDGVLSAAYGSSEQGAKDNGLNSGAIANFASALDIDQHSCKATKLVVAGTPSLVPALSSNACSDAIFQFATANATTNTQSGTCIDGTTCSFNFNIRCGGATQSVSSGKCSYTGKTCTVTNLTAGGTPADCDPDRLGQVCVPDCNALGAIFRSSPTVVGPPSGFLREEGYRTFQKNYATRHPTMFVATTDGMLHALKAIETTTTDGGTTALDSHEFWAFVPPAALPRLASNFPGGQQLILDGSPVVREVVWERPVDAGTLKDPTQWHTTLVAGFGAAGAGYYAMNVTDADCGGAGDCASASLGWSQPGTLAEAGGTKKGPHFLWQLTDVEAAASGEVRPVTRNAADNSKYVPLFGKQTGTPAITTVQLKTSAGQRQVGVAILPGGIDGPPGTGTCNRAIGNIAAYPAALDVSDTANGYNRRNAVRNWGINGNCSDPASGRSVTIVRLDNGQILRHFGRLGLDVPKNISSNKVTKDSPFDSPVIGTPVVYPNTVGAVAQKIFVGDADGTIWRIDVSDVCDETDMSTCNWAVNLFTDTFSAGFKDAVSGTSAITGSQPIAIPMVLSQSASGGIVVNAATGDQENITASTDMNNVVAVEEARPAGKAKVDWYNVLINGERVTGPMAVFDRTLYYATYQPAPKGSTTVCTTNQNHAKLWGVDYILPTDATALYKGGAFKWCPTGSIDARTGHCGAALAQFEDVSARPEINYTMIPGVALTASLSCTAVDLTDPTNSIKGATPSEITLTFTTGKSTTAGNLGTNLSGRGSLKRATPRVATTIDAWAFVLD